MIALAKYYDLQISVNCILPNLFENYFLSEQNQYVQFHNVKFKMPES